MGDIVSRDELSAAVSLNSVGFNLMRSVGPAAGGVIVALAGAFAAFAVNALSYVAIIGALAVWRPNLPKRSLPREPFGSAFSAGLRYVAMSPNLLKVILRSTVFGFAAIVILALLPVVVRDILGAGALTYGVLLGCFGLGAVGGAALNSHLRARFTSEVIVKAGFLTFALGCVILAFSRSSVLDGVGLLIAGASWVIALSLFNVTIQLSTPRWVVGRALSLYQTGVFGGMAVGSWVWGAVAAGMGAEGAILLAAGVLALGALLGLWVALPDFGHLNLDPLNHFKAPPLRLDMTQRSGPIMIMIDYEIAQEDVRAFLEVMAQRRRIRIRDGAQQWSLLRDLEHPDIWSEAYHVPTWVEYVRHNERRTHADAEVAERLMTLHRGAAPPRVHRMIERQAVMPHDDMPLMPS
jgi:MFS family permease